MHVKDVIGTNPDIFFGDDDLEPYTDKTFYSKFLHSFYLDNRRIALENVNKGLTLEGHLPLPAILKAIPSKALEKIAFADEGYDSAEDVIAFLEPVYCTEVMVHDEMGVYQREVESQVIESQIHFFEQTLPNLLRDVHASEKADEEKYAKNTRKRKDFLSVRRAISPFSFFFTAVLLLMSSLCLIVTPSFQRTHPHTFVLAFHAYVHSASYITPRHRHIFQILD